eukprot:760499-Hanusia_phi.AAC.1
MHSLPARPSCSRRTRTRTNSPTRSPSSSPVSGPASATSSSRTRMAGSRWRSPPRALQPTMRVSHSAPPHAMTEPSWTPRGPFGTSAASRTRFLSLTSTSGFKLHGRSCSPARCTDISCTGLSRGVCGSSGSGESEVRRSWSMEERTRRGGTGGQSAGASEQVDVGRGGGGATSRGGGLTVCCQG